MEETTPNLELNPSMRGSPEPSPGMEIITRYFTDFTPVQLQQFTLLEPLYKEWNSKINVISRKDIDSLYEKHVLHSLSIAAVFKFNPGTKIIDIGTGGGFPGIPLAIFFPGVKFHLVDGTAKKIKVVIAVAEALGLKNVTTEHCRAEEIKNKKFDFAVTRAVAPLKDLWNWSLPLLQSPAHSTGANKRYPPAGQDMPLKNGLICLKGGDLSQEIEESHARTRTIEISALFPQEVFKGKYVLFIAR